MKTEPMYVEPPLIAKATPHIKWINGVLHQMWQLENCYGIKTEWREVPTENVD